MKRYLKNSGIGLLQTLVIGAVVAAAGVFVMKTSQQQAKVSRTATQRITQHNFRDQVAESLQSGVSCANTLKKAGVLSDQKILSGIYGVDDAVMYAPQQKVEGMQVISEIKLVEYESAPGLRFHKKPVFLLVNTVAAREAAAQKSFGGQQKGHKIPLFLITRDDEVEMCTSDDSGAILTALREACLGFGGSFNEDTATCEKIHGQDGIVLKRINEKFCSTGNPICPHPYAGQTCTGTDVRGEPHPNWVFGAFDGSGEKVCHCLPKNCANPALYCLNTDLGTDWCQKECPVGTKDVWTEWSPSPDTVCSGNGFTQTQICTDPLGNLPRTRGATGTMTEGPGTCSFETPLPNGTTESGSNQVQSRAECDGICASGGKQNCNYVSDCGGTTCTDSTWSPGANTVCNGTGFTQTSDCGNTRAATGTKTDGTCATCTASTWLPAVTTVCKNKPFQQTSNCNDTRQALGTKTDGECAEKECKLTAADTTWEEGHMERTSNGTQSVVYFCRTTPGSIGDVIKEGETKRYTGAGTSYSVNGVTARQNASQNSGHIVYKCENGNLRRMESGCRGETAPKKKVCVYFRNVYSGANCTSTKWDHHTAEREMSEEDCARYCSYPLCKGQISWGNTWSGYYEEVHTGSCRMEER